MSGESTLVLLGEEVRQSPPPPVGRNHCLADCPSCSSYGTKLGRSPSAAGAAQRCSWSAGVWASGTAGRVSPGCFRCVSPCMPICASQPAAGSSPFCISPEGSPCPLAPATSSAAVAASTCWWGSTAGPRSGRWSSGSAPFQNEPPWATPRQPESTPGSSSPASAPWPTAPSPSVRQRRLLAAPASGCTAGPGEGDLRGSWEPSARLASSDPGPARHHPVLEFTRRGTWGQCPHLRVWAHPRPDLWPDHQPAGGRLGAQLDWSVNPHRHWPCGPVPTSARHGEVWGAVSGHGVRPLRAGCLVGTDSSRGFRTATSLALEPRPPVGWGGGAGGRNWGRGCVWELAGEIW